MTKEYSYENLDVWKQGCDAAIRVYGLTKSFPREEVFGLTSQIRRAAVSIPSNIAEGFGRGTDKEKIQFYIIARGSVAEVKTQLFLAKELKYVEDEQYKIMADELTIIHKMLNKMISYLKD